MSLADRIKAIGEWANLDESERALLAGQGLTASQADKMIENVVGTHNLPLGLAANFLINGRDYIVPMAVEEPSVVAAVIQANRRARVSCVLVSLTYARVTGNTAETRAPPRPRVR